ncbi:MAG: hypothetical protein NTV30_09775, partial [Chloroflexi bacterium]|nr:hypothetical protein [Chloroflexota bacterium]
MKITLNDLKRAITCYGDVSAFIPALSNITGKPPLNIISGLEQPAVLPEPDTLIQYTNPELALLLNKIINIKSIKPVQNNIDIKLVQINNNEKSDFIADTINEIHPDIITIDVSSLNFSINLLYAFSMLSAVGLPVYAEVFLKNNRNRYTIETIYPNDTIQIVLIESWLQKIPLVPVNIPFSTNYSAVNHIVSSNLKRTFFDDSDVPESEEVSNIQNTLLAEEIYSDPNETIFSSQQEISIEESSYIASRVFDISSAINNSKQKKLL